MVLNSSMYYIPFIVCFIVSHFLVALHNVLHQFIAIYLIMFDFEIIDCLNSGMIPFLFVLILFVRKKSISFLVTALGTFHIHFQLRFFWENLFAMNLF